MSRRDYVQLPIRYKPTKHDLRKWWVFENLNGVRCFWDGGISSGVATEQVPWAGTTNPKTKKLKEHIRPIATGLWSQYGNPIMAPTSFTEKLPPYSCEAILHHEDLEECRRICTSDYETSEFDKIQFAVFSAVPFGDFASNGLVSNTSTYVNFVSEEIAAWMVKYIPNTITYLNKGTNFEAQMFSLLSWTGWSKNVYVMQHTILPVDEMECKLQTSFELQKIIARGGKGAYFRNPMSIWMPYKTENFLRFDL